MAGRNHPILPHPNGAMVRIKAVPGASKSRVMGLLGDRVKVAVAAPAEEGKANQAILELLAKTLRCPFRQLLLLQGQGQMQKTVLVAGLSADEVESRLLAPHA